MKSYLYGERERERERRRKKETYAGYKFTVLNSCENYSPLHSNCIATARSHNMHTTNIRWPLHFFIGCSYWHQLSVSTTATNQILTPISPCKASLKNRQRSEKLSPQRPVPLTGILTTVSSPDLTLSWGEIYAKPAQKRYGYSSKGYMQNFTVVQVLHNNYWSCNLMTMPSHLACNGCSANVKTVMQLYSSSSRVHSY